MKTMARLIDFSQNARAHPWTGEYCLHRTAGPFESWMGAWKAGNGSAHRAILNDGTVVEYIPINMVAWHSGDHDYNQRSIGIEIVCDSPNNDTPLHPEQLVALVQLLNSLRSQASGPLQGSVHKDHVSTFCPGPDTVVATLRAVINTIDHPASVAPITPPTPTEELSMADVQAILDAVQAGAQNVQASFMAIHDRIDLMELNDGIVFVKSADSPDPTAIYCVMGGKKAHAPNVPDINNGPNLGIVRNVPWALLNSIPDAG